MMKEIFSQIMESQKDIIPQNRKKNHMMRMTFLKNEIINIWQDFFKLILF